METKTPRRLHSADSITHDKVVGYLLSGELIAFGGKGVLVGHEPSFTEWEIIGTWYRHGYLSAQENPGKQHEAIYTLRREAPPAECVPGLPHAYASLTIMQEIVSFAIQGQGTYRLSETPVSVLRTA